MSRVELAHAIKRAAARLVTFAELDPPIEVVLESERQLLIRMLMRFPVNTEAQAAVLNTQDAIQREEQEYLLKTGFFDGIDAQLEGKTQ